MGSTLSFVEAEMTCPVCSKALSPHKVGGVAVDVCDAGCAGIWFDQFEFRKFDEQKEPDVEKTLKVAARVRPSSTSDQLDCPKCTTIKMMRYFSSTKRKVTIDECPSCAGVWLDAGELTAIRQEFPTEESRKAAADEVYSELFDVKMELERDKSVREVENFGRMFRFILPRVGLLRLQLDCGRG